MVIHYSRKVLILNLFQVANFPFPTPPDEDSLEEAEKRLIRLGALRVMVKNNVVSHASF